MSSITEEQRKRIRENRERALALRSKSKAVEVGGKSSISGNLPVASSTSLSLQQFKFRKPDADKNLVGQKKIQSSSQLKTAFDKRTIKCCAIDTAKQKKISFMNCIRLVDCTCRLITSERFEIIAVYHDPLIELCKSISSRKYDNYSKRWSMHLKDYKNFLKQSNSVKSIKFAGFPSSVLAAFSNEINDRLKLDIKDNVNFDILGPFISGKLMKFQKEGIKFGLANKGRVLIGDDMGLGKTLQAIALSMFYREEWPLLIVCPSSVRFTWKQQLIDWMQESINPDYINVVTTGKQNCTNGLVNVISYDLMARLAQPLYDKEFKVIIMDESHLLKNPKTNRAKAAAPLLKASRRVILLSGTPALSRPCELFVQISSINPKVFANFHDYGIRYCDGKQLSFGWDFSGSSNLEELQLVLKKTVLIRRLKSEVLQQLPPKTRKIIRLNPEQIKFSKKLVEAEQAIRNGGVKNEDRQSSLMVYYYQTAVVKTKAIVEYILEFLETNDEKLLVFCHHQIVLDALEKAITKKDYSFIRIDGRTSSLSRAEYCQRFQGDDGPRLAILSITAANAGIHLTAASVVVFAELYWNPGILKQAEDRTHRIGQRNHVNIHYLIAAKTADDLIWPLINSKLEILEKAGLCNDNFSNVEDVTVEDPTQHKIEDYIVKDEKRDLSEFMENIDIDEFESDIPPSKKVKLISD